MSYLRILLPSKCCCIRISMQFKPLNFVTAFLKDCYFQGVCLFKINVSILYLDSVHSAQYGVFKILIFYLYGLKYLFTGAVEKQKLVYILNRDAAARLTISSPLEAHKSHTLVYHTVGIDVGFENPMFACLEMDYEVLKLYFKFTQHSVCC